MLCMMSDVFNAVMVELDLVLLCDEEDHGGGVTYNGCDLGDGGDDRNLVGGVVTGYKKDCELTHRLYKHKDATIPSDKPIIKKRM